MTVPYELPRCCRVHHQDAVETIEAALANDLAAWLTKYVEDGMTIEEAADRVHEWRAIYLRRVATALDLGVGWARARLEGQTT